MAKAGQDTCEVLVKPIFDDCLDAFIQLDDALSDSQIRDVRDVVCGDLDDDEVHQRRMVAVARRLLRQQKADG